MAFSAARCPYQPVLPPSRLSLFTGLLKPGSQEWELGRPSRQCGWAPPPHVRTDHSQRRALAVYYPSFPSLTPVTHRPSQSLPTPTLCLRLQSYEPHTGKTEELEVASCKHTPPVLFQRPAKYSALSGHREDDENDEDDGGGGGEFSPSRQIS